MTKALLILIIVSAISAIPIEKDHICEEDKCECNLSTGMFSFNSKEIVCQRGEYCVLRQGNSACIKPLNPLQKCEDSENCACGIEGYLPIELKHPCKQGEFCVLHQKFGYCAPKLIKNGETCLGYQNCFCIDNALKIVNSEAKELGTVCKHKQVCLTGNNGYICAINAIKPMESCEFDQCTCVRKNMYSIDSILCKKGQACSLNDDKLVCDQKRVIFPGQQCPPSDPESCTCVPNKDMAANSQSVSQGNYCATIGKGIFVKEVKTRIKVGEVCKANLDCICIDETDPNQFALILVDHFCDSNEKSIVNVKKEIGHLVQCASQGYCWCFSQNRSKKNFCASNSVCIREESDSHCEEYPISNNALCFNDKCFCSDFSEEKKVLPCVKDSFCASNPLRCISKKISNLEVCSEVKGCFCAVESTKKVANSYATCDNTEKCIIEKTSKGEKPLCVGLTIKVGEMTKKPMTFICEAKEPLEGSTEVLTKVCSGPQDRGCIVKDGEIQCVSNFIQNLDVCKQKACYCEFDPEKPHEEPVVCEEQSVCVREASGKRTCIDYRNPKTDFLCEKDTCNCFGENSFKEPQLKWAPRTCKMDQVCLKSPEGPTCKPPVTEKNPIAFTDLESPFGSRCAYYADIPLKIKIIDCPKKTQCSWFPDSAACLEPDLKNLIQDGNYCTNRRRGCKCVPNLEDPNGGVRCKAGMKCTIKGNSASCDVEKYAAFWCPKNFPCDCGTWASRSLDTARWCVFGTTNSYEEKEPEGKLTFGVRQIMNEIKIQVDSGVWRFKPEKKKCLGI